MKTWKGSTTCIACRGAPALAIMAMVAFCQSVLAQDSLMPLHTYRADSNAHLVYVFKRCAAISVFMAIKFRRIDNPKKKAESNAMSAELMNRYDKFSTFAFNVQTHIMQGNGEEISADTMNILIKDIETMVGHYRANDDRAYQLEGRTISQLAFDDSEYCTILTKAEWYGK